MTRALAWTTAGAALCMLMLGSVVWGTGSSLACPDWPTCYGSFMPPMRGGILFEHSHRLLGAAIGIAVIALGWRLRRAAPPLRRAALFATGLVVLQGLLGGMTVLLRLSPLVSIAHLALGMALFSLLVAIAWSARDRADAATANAASTRRWVQAALAATYAQVVFGGVVRHTGAAFACFDLPLCIGKLWPSSSVAQIQVVHRAFALVVVGMVLAAAASVWRNPQHLRAARHVAIIAAGLAVIQIAIGIGVIGLQLRISAVTAHVGVAAALLAALLLLTLSVGRREAAAE